MMRRALSLILIIVLFFQQTSFAQVAAVELNLPSKISRMAGAIAFERFRPVQLRYIAYDPLNNQLRNLLDKGSSPDIKTSELENVSKELLNFFLIGLTLPNDTFWVNLRPDGEDNIIDDRLARTDVGRILLEADVQLKKDMASFTSPQTPEGKEYWDKLYRKAGQLYGRDEVTIPTLTRPWIVPGDIIVRETLTSAYVYKAGVKVMLEEDYFKTKGAVKANLYDFKDDRAKELNKYSSQLIRELIIPKLTREVNNAKRYASLRQVYYSLILAQWFKARFAGKPGSYANLIDSQDLTNLTSKESWTKSTYFNAYKKSFSEGEYKIQESTYGSGGQVIRSYFSGGVVAANPGFIEDLARPRGAASVSTLVESADNNPPSGARLVSVDDGKKPEDGTPSMAAATYKGNARARAASNEDMSPAIKGLLARNFSELYVANGGQVDRAKKLKELLGKKDSRVTVIGGYVFVALPGLAQATKEAGDEQLAHIALWDSYGQTVVYIDADRAGSSRVKGHELVEIAAIGSELRNRGLAFATLRSWMRENPALARDFRDSVHKQANIEYNVSGFSSGRDGLDEYETAMAGLAPSFAASVQHLGVLADAADLNSGESERFVFAAMAIKRFADEGRLDKRAVRGSLSLSICLETLADAEGKNSLRSKVAKAILDLAEVGIFTKEALSEQEGRAVAPLQTLRLVSLFDSDAAVRDALAAVRKALVRQGLFKDLPLSAEEARQIIEEAYPYTRNKPVEAAVKMAIEEKVVDRQGLLDICKRAGFAGRGRPKGTSRTPSLAASVSEGKAREPAVLREFNGRLGLCNDIESVWSAFRSSRRTIERSASFSRREKNAIFEELSRGAEARIAQLENKAGQADAGPWTDPQAKTDWKISEDKSTVFDSKMSQTERENALSRIINVPAEYRNEYWAFALKDIYDNSSLLDDVTAARIKRALAEQVQAGNKFAAEAIAKINASVVTEAARAERKKLAIAALKKELNVKDAIELKELGTSFYDVVNDMLDTIVEAHFNTQEWTKKQSILRARLDQLGIKDPLARRIWTALTKNNVIGEATVFTPPGEDSAAFFTRQAAQRGTPSLAASVSGGRRNERIASILTKNGFTFEPLEVLAKKLPRIARRLPKPKGRYRQSEYLLPLQEAVMYKGNKIGFARITLDINDIVGLHGVWVELYENELDYETTPSALSFRVSQFIGITPDSIDTKLSISAVNTIAPLLKKAILTATAGRQAGQPGTPSFAASVSDGQGSAAQAKNAPLPVNGNSPEDMYRIIELYIGLDAVFSAMSLFNHREAHNRRLGVGAPAAEDREAILDAMEASLLVLDANGRIAKVAGITDDRGKFLYFREIRTPSFAASVSDGKEEAPKAPDGISAPTTDSGGINSRENNPGGIDFRNLPSVMQAVTNLNMKLQTIPLAGVSGMDLSKEMNDMNRMVAGRMSPSADRVAECFKAFVESGGAIDKRRELLSCIGQIISLDEENCSATDPAVRQILTILESGRPAGELQEDFAQAA